MISLAFVISFVVSAVALLLGIVIFSDMSEAMGATLPEILVEIPTTPEVEGLWFAREHCASTSCEPTSKENRMFFSEVGGGVQTRASGTDQTITTAYLGKVFDKSELDGKQVTVELALNILNGQRVEVSVFDGELDPMPFGTLCGADPDGLDCFPDESAIITSGSGGEVELFRTSNANGEGVGVIKNHTGSANLSSFDSPTGKVTLVVQQIESNACCGTSNITYQIMIEDNGTYNFKLDPEDPSWSGTNVSCHRECNVSVNTPDSYWTVTSNPPPPLPVFNSEETLSINEKFNNAQSIGFTVIGVMPIALFFGLFTILGRVDGEQ